MSFEINELSASAQLGSDPAQELRLSDAEIARVADRVVALLAQREHRAQMARPDATARSILTME